MVFNDERIATSYLARISYFRLKYYWVDMIDVTTGDFIEGTNFNTVIDRYEFDKKLRNILFGAIEVLESRVAYEVHNDPFVSNQYGFMVS